MTHATQLRPAELKARLDSGELWQILDVREPWEIDIVALGDSLRIPMAEIPFRHGELPDEGGIAVLCHSGVRSDRVAAWLLQNGHAQVVNIAGGIDAWSRDVDPGLARY